MINGRKLDQRTSITFKLIKSGRTVPLKKIVVPDLAEKIDALACSMQLLKIL
jgi:hypothetical protein